MPVKRYLRRATGEWAGRPWAIGGLIVFVLVDIVLVGWALTAVRAPAHGVPAHVTHTTTPPPTVTPTPSAAVAPAAVAPTRVLAALDGTVAWRAVTGACPATRATLQQTTDGGASWQTSDASGSTGASSPLRILVTSRSQVSVVALGGTGCAPQLLRTYVSGADWESLGTSLAGYWFVDPATASTVHTPHGNVSSPCPAVVGLAARSVSQAAVLCADHHVFRTSNGGGSWGSPLTESGSVALGSTSTGYIVADVGSAACAGVSIAALPDTSSSAAPVGCVKTARPGVGDIAVADGGGTLWIWAGDTLARSNDGGRTWQ